jgi:hypothetical protein
VKRIVAIFTIAGSFAIVGCGAFGPGEEVRQEPARTVYRAPDQSPLDVPEMPPLREKVPGETR